MSSFVAVLLHQQQQQPSCTHGEVGVLHCALQHSGHIPLHKVVDTAGLPPRPRHAHAALAMLVHIEFMLLDGGQNNGDGGHVRCKTDATILSI